MGLAITLLLLLVFVLYFKFFKKKKTHYQLPNNLTGNFTARGTAAFWVDYFDLPFKGAGTYQDADGFIYEITKDGNNPKPEDLSKNGFDKNGKLAHRSLEKYGYGQMFFGKVTHENFKPNQKPLEKA